MKRDEVFKNELNYIKDNDIKMSASILLEKVPEYFFSIPASSTGKYHPSYALGDGGLVRHTKAAIRMAFELYNIYKFDDRKKDLMLFALMFHDTIKKGEVEEKYTRFDHPLLASEFIKKYSKELLINKDDIDFICSCIESHMGRFNTSSYSDVILPIPSTPEEKFVHMCDFLASRKVIDVPFNGNDIVVE